MKVSFQKVPCQWFIALPIKQHENTIMTSKKIFEIPVCYLKCPVALYTQFSIYIYLLENRLQVVYFNKYLTLECLSRKRISGILVIQITSSKWSVCILARHHSYCKNVHNFISVTRIWDILSWITILNKTRSIFYHMSFYSENNHIPQ